MSNNEKEKSLNKVLSEQKTDIKNILGYGEKLRVFDGQDDDGNDKFIEYHFCPASISDLPDMIEAINDFGSITANNSFTKEGMAAACKVLQISLKKAHGEIPVETLMEQIGLGGLAKAIRIALSLNDFLSEMQAINGMFKEIPNIQNQLPTMKMETSKMN